MKFFSITPFILLAGVSAVSGQGLYNLATLDDDTSSSPLTYFAGVNFAYSDNVAPVSGDEEDSASVNAFVGASLSNATSRTQYSASATVGVQHFFENVEVASDDTFPNVSLDFNISHEVSERLRVVANAYVRYQLEPGYEYGFVNDRAADPYFNYGIDVGLGYRWTERLGSYTGITYTGLDFDDDNDQSRNDRESIALYHSFRYQVSPQTVATLGGRYSETTSSGTAGDSENIFITGGLEHRFSPTAIGVLRAGVQIRDVDGGSDSTSPFVEAAYRAKINSQFALRSFLRYSIEDYGTSFSNATFDELNVLRLGISATYKVSPRLSLNTGVDYINNSYESGRLVPGPGGVSDFDEDLVNAYIGFSLGLTDNVSLNGSYNYTDSSSDNEILRRSYERNRVSLGVTATF